MRRYYDSVEIAELLGKMVTAELSEKERHQLALLINRNNLNNKEDIEKIINQTISFESVSTDVIARERLLTSLWGKIHRKKRMFRQRILRYASAAAVLAIMVSSIYLAKWTQISSEEVNIKLIVEQKTVLEYPSGHEVVLPEEVNVLSMLDSNDITKNEEKEPSLYTIKVPLGVSHSLSLEDGTSIVLYPGSKLSFPTHFATSERLVTLQGEGYFNVSPDKDRPFKVQAGGASVRVLGTSFNIRAYQDENVVEAALVSGIIDINDTKLIPDQMAVFNRDEQSLRVHEVDADIYKERAGGMFVFDNKPLEEIMHDLSKWFDFDYSYSDETMRKKRFRLKLSRTEDFKEIMEMMEFTGEAIFRITDRHIEVLPGKQHKTFFDQLINNQYVN
jgi:hypothetical protein